MIVTCVECGEEFEAKRKDASICSARCRQRRRRRSRNGGTGVQARGMALVPVIRDIARSSSARQRADDEGYVYYGRDPSEKAYRGREIVHDLLLDKLAAGEIPTNGRFVFYWSKRKIVRSLRAMPTACSTSQTRRPDNDRTGCGRVPPAIYVGKFTPVISPEYYLIYMGQNDRIPTYARCKVWSGECERRSYI
jgi:hypothetical protein